MLKKSLKGFILFSLVLVLVLAPFHQTYALQNVKETEDPKKKNRNTSFLNKTFSDQEDVSEPVTFITEPNNMTGNLLRLQKKENNFTKTALSQKDNQSYYSQLSVSSNYPILQRVLDVNEQIEPLLVEDTASYPQKMNSIQNGFSQIVYNSQDFQSSDILSQPLSDNSLEMTLDADASNALSDLDFQDLDAQVENTNPSNNAPITLDRIKSEYTIKEATATPLPPSSSTNWVYDEIYKSYAYHWSGKSLVGWHKLGDHVFYFDASKNFTALKGLQKIGKTTYLFNAQGIRQVGWHVLNGNAYYFDPLRGGGMVTGRFKFNQTEYLFNNQGHKTFGWHVLNGKVFYFDPDFSGGLVTGVRKVNGYYYLFDKTQGRQYGWKLINNKKYFFDPNTNGILPLGFTQINKAIYYFTPQGAKEGLFDLKGKNGAVSTYFTQNGVLQSGLKVIDGRTYYFGENYSSLKGFYKIANHQYYFNPHLQGRSVFGFVRIHKRLYYFDPYSQYPGQALSGLQKIGDDYYSFDPENNNRAGRGWFPIGDRRMYFTDGTRKGMDFDGKAYKGLQRIAGNLYYFDPSLDYKTAKGWKEIDGQRYFFGPKGVALTGWHKLSGQAYHFNALGVLDSDAHQDIRKLMNQGKLPQNKSRYLGVDVSYWQGFIDWAQVKRQGVDFAMIRLGYSHSIDSTADRNIREAAKNGISVGVYYYSYAESVEEAKSEAKFLVSALEPYKGILTMPVAIDVEEEGLPKIASRQTVTDINKVLLSAVENAGWFSTIYINPSWLENVVYKDQLANYDLWLANWRETKPDDYAFNLWQFSATGRIQGINGEVDMNYAYINYPALIYSSGKNFLR